MKLTRILAATLLLASTAPAQAMQVLSTDKMSMDMYGRAQMIGVGQYVPDPWRDNMRIYLFMKQARIGFRGNYEDMKFDTQFAFGGEISNPTNNDLGLYDFVADIPVRPLGEDTWFKIGQFRVPYSREGLSDRGFMEYGDRSVANTAFYQSRDYGLALLATKGVWTGTLGTFSSGARGVPQRYLPERFGVPYTVVRFGYNDGADEDIYHVKPNPLGAKRTTKAVMLNALYTKDTLVGHSSALQSRTIDKNLLMDSGFNPFINQGGGGGTNGLGTIAGTQTMQRGDYWSVGGDAVIHHPLGADRQVNAEVEANWGGYQNRFGVLHAAAARAQADYQQGAYGIGLRYGLLHMDKKSGFLTSSATGTGTTAGANVNRRISNEMGIPIHEIAPSLTWRIKGQNVKVVADLPIYINCPIWYDRMGNVTPSGSQPHGAYAFIDPTGQTQNSLLATPGNQTARRTIVQGRMLFQFMF